MEKTINILIKQAIVAHKDAKLEEAEQLYNKILEIQSTHPDANHNLGVLKIAQNKISEGLSLFKIAIETNPNSEQFWISYINILIEENRLEEAKKSCISAIKLRPNFLEVYNALGVILSELNRLKEAEIILKKLIKLKPDYYDAYNNLANINKLLGKLEEAEFNYNKAIMLKPKHASTCLVHYNLSLIKTYIKEDEQFYIMKNLYLDENLINHHRCHLSFALAKAYEDLNQIDNSFKFYSDGNALRKKMLNYNIHQDIEYFDQLKKSCLNIKKNSLKNVNLINNPRPIFIIGMPRSGTTLIEQIISSHSNVTGAGELEYLTQFGEAIAIGKSKVDSKTLNLLRENYLKKLKEVSQGKLMVIDKMPLNFRYIALINSAFPDAKIIHVKRNPAATCWGNYKRLFVSKNGYSFDLDDLTTYYELYENLMHFWEDLYSDQIYNLNYETLVKNQEDETKKLIQHLGLKWQDECLKPENNKRIVHTASTLQVRRKVFQGSSEKWKKFEPFLNGVFNHFEN